MQKAAKQAKKRTKKQTRPCWHSAQCLRSDEIVTPANLHTKKQNVSEKMNQSIAVALKGLKRWRAVSD